MEESRGEECRVKGSSRGERWELSVQTLALKRKSSAEVSLFYIQDYKTYVIYACKTYRNSGFLQTLVEGWAQGKDGPIRCGTDPDKGKIPGFFFNIAKTQTKTLYCSYVNEGFF